MQKAWPGLDKNGCVHIGSSLGCKTTALLDRDLHATRSNILIHIVQIAIHNIYSTYVAVVSSIIWQEIMM